MRRSNATSLLNQCRNFDAHFQSWGMLVGFMFVVCFFPRGGRGLGKKLPAFHKAGNSIQKLNVFILNNQCVSLCGCRYRISSSS